MNRQYPIFYKCIGLAADLKFTYGAAGTRWRIVLKSKDGSRLHFHLLSICTASRHTFLNIISTGGRQFGTRQVNRDWLGEDRLQNGCPCQVLMRFFFVKYISISDEGAVLSNATLCTTRKDDRETEREREEKIRAADTRRGWMKEKWAERGKKGDRSCNILGSHCTCPISWQANSLLATAWQNIRSFPLESFRPPSFHLTPTFTSSFSSSIFSSSSLSVSYFPLPRVSLRRAVLENKSL